MLAATIAAMLLLVQEPSLAEIDVKLRKAVDRDSYEAGAVDSARALAAMRNVEAMELRLELFDEKWSTYRGAFLRDWFYSGMQRAETREEADLLVRAAADKKRSEWQRVLCLRALEQCAAQVDGELLFDPAFASAPDEVRRAWQAAAGACLSAARAEFDKPAGASAARAALLETGAPFLGLARLPDWTAEEIAAVGKAAEGAKNPGDRALALRTAGANPAGSAAFVKAARVALRREECGPRAAAIETAGAHHAIELVPDLIAFLEAEAKRGGGRFVHDAAESLRRITGLPFGPKPEMWRHWWIKEGAAWLERSRAEADGRGAGEGVARQAESDTMAARFFGLPVDSFRIAIVVDGSGSMSASKLGALATVEAAAREVEKFCTALPRDAVFQVWIVETKPTAAFKKAMPANAAQRAKGMDFLRKRAYRSTSSVVEAIESASLDPDIDTIVFVGDGGSSAGKHASDEHVLEALRHNYARTGVRIHTILVTDNTAHEDLMQDLAGATGGRTAKPSGSSG
jgi:hypothetical protein